MRICEIIKNRCETNGKNKKGEFYMKGNYQQLLMKVIVFSEADYIRTSAEVQYDSRTGDAYFGDFWD